ncbi:MAG: hypothetical protein QOF77_2087 [Solirubrobacteraceae bacterium]|jgi:uncharacterized integral membrane protein|nr:hypothetical protein [Solirubrobacteraceae bacterium]
MASDHTPLTEPKPAKARRGSPGAILAALGGALVAVFAVLNAQSVEVNWLAATTRTPLIVVIVLFLLVGFALGRLLASLPGRGRRGKS